MKSRKLITYPLLGAPDFSGQTYTILCRTGNREIVNDSVYARNSHVEERFGNGRKPEQPAGILQIKRNNMPLSVPDSGICVRIWRIIRNICHIHFPSCVV